MAELYRDSGAASEEGVDLRELSGPHSPLSPRDVRRASDVPQ